MTSTNSAAFAIGVHDPGVAAPHAHYLFLKGLGERLFSRAYSTADGLDEAAINGQLAADFDVMATRLQAMQEANRRLLQDVSHELRSPLARMSVALEIARKKGPGPVTAEFERLVLESQRLEILVNDVLGLLRESSEYDARSDEQFDLAGLLTDLVDVVNYEVPEGKPGIRWQSPEPQVFQKWTAAIHHLG